MLARVIASCDSDAYSALLQGYSSMFQSYHDKISVDYCGGGRGMSEIRWHS